MKKLTLNYYLRKDAATKKGRRQLTGQELPDRLIDYDPTFGMDDVGSPLTGCTYQVKALFNRKARFAGFQVSFDVGDCAVNSPLLHHNDMALACQLGRVLFQNFVLSDQYPVEVLNLFDLEHPEIVNATAGFYVPVDDLEVACRLVLDMSTLLEGLHNHRASWHRAYHDRLQFHGSPRNGYWKLQGKQHSLKFYSLNDPWYWQSQSTFAWSDVRLPDDFLAMCQNFVFIEVAVDRDWLKKHKLTQPSSWEGGERSGYDLMWELVRQDFCLDDPLATELPSEEVLESLNAQDREVVTDYLYRASDPKTAAMLMQAEENPRHSFKQLCKRVKAATGLNLNIPWSVVETKLSGRSLSTVLAQATDFGLPAEFEQYVFGSPVHELKLPTLQELQEHWLDAYGELDGR